MGVHVPKLVAEGSLGNQCNAEAQVYLTPEDWDSDFPYILE